MSARSIFSEALAALNFNRQRSILTTISLAWGVACFAILYFYGDSFHTELSVAFRALGQDLVVIVNGHTSSQPGRGEPARPNPAEPPRRERVRGGHHFSPTN